MINDSRCWPEKGSPWRTAVLAGLVWAEAAPDACANPEGGTVVQGTGKITS